MSETPLHLACKEKSDKTILIEMVKKSTPDMWKKKDGNGDTPFHVACGWQISNAEAFDLMLTHGAESTWKIQNYEGETPFHYACLYQYQKGGSLEEVFKIMFAHGANSTWKIKDSLGRTPFHTTCISQKDPEVFKIMFTHGANSTWNIQDKDGETPFHHACEYQKDPEVYKHMFAHGANSTWNIKNKDGKTPFHIACEYQKDHKLFEIMLAHGANITLDILDKNNNKPINYVKNSSIQNLITSSANAQISNNGSIRNFIKPSAKTHKTPLALYKKILKESATVYRVDSFQDIPKNIMEKLKRGDIVVDKKEPTEVESLGSYENPKHTKIYDGNDLVKCDVYDTGIPKEFELITEFRNPRYFNSDIIKAVNKPMYSGSGGWINLKKVTLEPITETDIQIAQTFDAKHQGQLLHSRQSLALSSGMQTG